MAYEEIRCPNCGSSDIEYVNGNPECKRCKTKFSNSNETHHSRTTSSTNTYVHRDEAEIERIKLEERIDKRGTAVVICVLAVIIVLLGLGILITASNPTVYAPVNSDSAVRGKNVDIVVSMFEDAGFRDVQKLPLADLKSAKDKDLDTVSVVMIEGEDRWVSGIRQKKKAYKQDSPVKIYYHSLKNP